MSNHQIVSRRGCLSGIALGSMIAFGIDSTWAMGKSSLLSVGSLKGLCIDTRRNSGIEKLLWEAQKRTSMKTQDVPRDLKITNDLLYEFPLLVLSGEGPLETIEDEQRLRLRHFLKLGGTLFVDDASPLGDDRFHRSWRLEMDKIWPAQKVKPLPSDHTFYKTFYMLRGSAGRVARDEHLFGIDFEDRSPIIYSRNDLFGALCRDPSGQWAFPLRSGGAFQRERSLRFGVNLLMYATCLNYKRDQVHVPAILKRRKWRVDR